MKWLLLGLTVAGLLGIALTPRPQTAALLVPIADVTALSRTSTEEPSDAETRRFAFLLPGGTGAVVLRAMPRTEWAGFQVRAVAWDVIEREMLAACLVSPVLAPDDVASIPDVLRRHLQRAVNEASGFEVFSLPPTDAARPGDR